MKNLTDKSRTKKDNIYPDYLYALEDYDEFKERINNEDKGVTFNFRRPIFKVVGNMKIEMEVGENSGPFNFDGLNDDYFIFSPFQHTKISFLVSKKFMCEKDFKKTMMELKLYKESGE